MEAHGKKLKFATDKGNFHNISLGQGQEVVAESAMDLAAKEGHWVVLQVKTTFLHHISLLCGKNHNFFLLTF